MKKMMLVAVSLMAVTVMAEAANEAENQAKAPRRAPMADRPMMGDPLMMAVSNPMVAEMIGLSEEQKAKIKELAKSRGGNKELQEKIRKGTEKQMELLKAEKIDEAAVMAAIDEVFEARKAVAKAQTKVLIGVHEVLTPEQVAKAREGFKALRAMRGGHDRPHKASAEAGDNQPPKVRRDRKRGPKADSES